MKLRQKISVSLVCVLALVGNSFGVSAQERTAPQQRKATLKTSDGQTKEFTTERDEAVFVDQNGQRIRINSTQDPQFNVPVPEGNGIGAVFYKQNGDVIRFSGQDNVLVRSPYGPGQDATFNFISSEMSFDSKPVKGAPFSADVESQSIQTLADGNRIIRRSSGAIFRDTEGRTRRESTVNAIGPFAGGDPLRTITINDPVAWATYSLDPQNRIARKMGVSYARTQATTTEATARMAVRSNNQTSEQPKKINVSGGVLQGTALKRVQPAYPSVAKAARATGAVQVQITISEEGKVIDTNVISGHPLLREAAAQAASQWEFKPTEMGGVPVKVQGILTFNFTLLDDNKNEEAAQRVNSPNAQRVMIKTNEENLGRQLMEGVEAEGKRATTTIPAGAIGNELPIEIVTETWYSPELQTTIYNRHNDPRTGESIYRMTNIRRGDPDASLFQVPPDYTVKEMAKPIPDGNYNLRVTKPDNN